MQRWVRERVARYVYLSECFSRRTLHVVAGCLDIATVNALMRLGMYVGFRTSSKVDGLDIDSSGLVSWCSSMRMLESVCGVQQIELLLW